MHLRKTNCNVCHRLLVYRTPSHRGHVPGNSSLSIYMQSPSDGSRERLNRVPTAAKPASDIGEKHASTIPSLRPYTPYLAPL